MYVGDYVNIVLKTDQKLALPNQCVPQRRNLGIASKFCRELMSVMVEELCTEKPSHGKYPCAAGNLDTLKVPL